MKIGALAGVVKGALLFSWEIASEGMLLENSRLETEEIPVVVFCRNCGEHKTLKAINNFVCPKCESSVSEIVSGRELLVTVLEITS